MNKAIALVLSAILVALSPSTSLGQDLSDASAVLSQTAKAMGVSRLKTIHYSGSGSSYLIAQGPMPAGGWPHSVMRSYARDLDLERGASRTQLVRAEGTPPVEKTLNRAIDANSPWSSQYEFWITPYGFLKGAIAYKATMESKTVAGTAYRAVTFTLPNGHRVVGYINDKDLIEKVETWIGDKDSILAEALYRDYADFNGVKVPSMITEKQGGELSLILVVKEVKVEN